MRPGIAAFFPNAEAIGLPAGVIVDRDAANGAKAPVPRAYYPPDARLQYSVPRRQGLGNGSGTPTTGNPVRVAPHRVFNFNQNGNVGAPTNPPTGGWNPLWGNSSYQSQPTTAGTPVPPNWPKNQTYSDPSGNIWAYNTSAGAWQVQVQSSYSSTVPSTWPTSQPYIDSSGNTWTWSGAGGWQITTYANSAATAANTAASSTGAATATTPPSWFTDPTQELISGVPNWGLVAGGGVILLMLMKRK